MYIQAWLADQNGTRVTNSLRSVLESSADVVAHVMGEKIKAWNGQHAGDFAKKLQQAEQTIQTNTAQLTNDTDAAAVREAGSFIAEFAAVCAAHSQAVVCTEN